MLLERDDVKADSKDENSRTLLLWAAESRYETVMRLLLERDVDANSKDDSDQTPLFEAAGLGHDAVMRLLLERDSVKADSKAKTWYSFAQLSASVPPSISRQEDGLVGTQVV